LGISTILPLTARRLDQRQALAHDGLDLAFGQQVEQQGQGAAIPVAFSGGV